MRRNCLDAKHFLNAVRFLLHLDTNIIVYMSFMAITARPFAENRECYDLHLIKEQAEIRVHLTGLGHLILDTMQRKSWQ